MSPAEFAQPYPNVNAYASAARSRKMLATRGRCGTSGWVRRTEPCSAGWRHFAPDPALGQSLLHKRTRRHSMQLGFSEEQQRRWLDDNHAAVQAKVPDPIVAYQLFYRTG